MRPAYYPEIAINTARLLVTNTTNKPIKTLLYRFRNIIEWRSGCIMDNCYCHHDMENDGSQIHCRIPIPYVRRSDVRMFVVRAKTPPTSTWLPSSTAAEPRRCEKTSTVYSIPAARPFSAGADRGAMRCPNPASVAAVGRRFRPPPSCSIALRRRKCVKSPALLGRTCP
jgi:hypothetical protein